MHILVGVYFSHVKVLLHIYCQPIIVPQTQLSRPDPNGMGGACRYDGKQWNIGTNKSFVQTLDVISNFGTLTTFEYNMTYNLVGNDILIFRIQLCICIQLD